MTVATLSTTIGDFPLLEYKLHAWSFLHTGAVVTVAQEAEFLSRENERLPYGVMLWPSSIALAHDLLARAEQLRGKRVLELGAGTGIPGIVAARYAARVLQVDRSEPALHVCRLNVERNRATNVQVKHADWDEFHSDEPFDLIVGADVLYATSKHARLRTICEQYLAPGGLALFADPLRAESLTMLGGLEGSGWKVTLAKWTIEIEAGPRSIAIYEASKR